MPEKTINSLVAAAQISFGQSMMKDEVLQHLLPNDILFVAYDVKQNAFAFAAGNFNPDHFYLAGAVVSPNNQGLGVYTHLTKLRIQHSFLNDESLDIKTRTQNPNVEAGICRALREITGLDGYVERKIIPGLYGRQLTAVIPREISADSPYAQLNYPRGDAFELIFKTK